MTIPKYLMEAKLCNRDTCAEVEQLNSLVNSCQKEIRRLKEEYIMLQNSSKEYEDKLLKENQRLNYVLNELRQFVIELYKVEYNQTGDWWLQEQLSSWYDDMNIATDFKIDDIISKRLNELKESDK